MKTRLLNPKDDCRKAMPKLVGQFPDRLHLRETLDEDTRVIAPDGRIVALLLCNAIPPALHMLAYELWKPVHDLPDNRPTAVGSLSLPRHKDYETFPGRRGVHKIVLEDVKDEGARQGILGYLDGHPCHKTPLTVKSPYMLEGNRRLIELVDTLYALWMPELHSIQRAEMEKAGPLWRLWDTVFSTIYLGRDFRTAYHIDSGNLRGVMSAIMPMGSFTGGELVLARWRIAIAYKPGDLLLFDPQQVHGNLPFRGERLAAIFYCERRIANCGK